MHKLKLKYYKQFILYFYKFLFAALGGMWYVQKPVSQHSSWAKECV